MVKRIEPADLPLRERKKALTRQAILDAAARLFAEHGYDNVTVADIADAATVSVKTLFVYFRSKEDLVFAESDLLDALLAGLDAREPGVSAAQAVADVLITVIHDEAGAARGLEDYHHAYGGSVSLRSGLLRMWSEWEDRVTEHLAGDAPATPMNRLHAIQLVGLVRTTTSPELRAAIDPADPQALERWLRAAAKAVEASSPAG